MCWSGPACVCVRVHVCECPCPRISPSVSGPAMLLFVLLFSHCGGRPSRCPGPDKSPYKEPDQRQGYPPRDTKGEEVEKGGEGEEMKGKEWKRRVKSEKREHSRGV